jgi:hypothetical protein
MEQQGITPGQLRKIFASARELGWDDDRLHNELEQVIGIRSLRELSHEAAGLFIDFCVSEGASPSHPAYHGHQVAADTNVIPLASPAQRDYVSRLRATLKLTEQSPYYLAILKRALGHTTIRTMDDAHTTIGILQKLVERYQGAPGRLGSNERDGNRRG